MSRYIYCDPPGSVPGFPALMPISAFRNENEFIDYLKSKGYPNKLIPLALKYSRFRLPTEYP